MHAIPTETPHLAREALIDFPRPDTLAHTLVRQWLEKQGVDLAPEHIDVVTVHYQRERLHDDERSFRENAIVTQKMSLVEALLGNWQGESASGYGGFHYGDWAGMSPTGTLNLVKRLKPLDLFSNGAPYMVFNGLYRRTAPASYGPHTLLPIRAEQLQSFIWGLHLHNLYKTSLNQYWAGRLPHYQRALKISYIAACNKQVKEGSLSQPARRMVWQAAGLTPRQTSQVHVSMLNVYGYTTTSILCLKHTTSTLTVLYLPGNASPFHEFADRQAMQQWFARQCQDPLKREALLQAFTPADRPDGLDFCGVATALIGLGRFPAPHRFPVNHPGFAVSGIWDPQSMVDFQAESYSPAIKGDLFEYLALRQKQRSYEDADSQITTNHQIDKERWVSFLNLAMLIAAPLVMVVPELTPLLVVGGLSQFSLGLDQAINGKNLEDKTEGVTNQVYGLFNAIPTAGNIERSSGLFCWSRPGFVTPSRLQALIGESTAGETSALELSPAQSAFREAPRLSSSETACVVNRVDDDLNHRFSARFDEAGETKAEWVEYELSSDSFIKSRDANVEDPPRWVIDNLAMSPLEAVDRTVTDEQRMATLKRLGINLRLPVDLTPYDLYRRRPIPRVITSLWVGDRLIAGEFLDALAHNAQVLKNTDYRFQLLLSRQVAEAYQANREILAVRAPTLEVRPLEDEPLYESFVDSPYYPQYHAAINSVATNFSSASDILRYRVLHHFGGLYLDADDRLLFAARGQSVPALLNTDLSTTSNGLLLSLPVSNDQLGMYIKYNTSMIGSHPGNPTLNLISLEIRRRFDLVPAFYDSRPDLEDNPAAFAVYARQLNQLTGPGVLNDVIDQQLPWLRQLREICNLLASPVRDIRQVVDLPAYLRTVNTLVPLDQVAHIGQAHSWQYI